MEITVSGALSGGSCESTSFRYGQVFFLFFLFFLFFVFFCFLFVLVCFIFCFWSQEKKKLISLP